MSVLENIIDEIKMYGKLDISRYGIFNKNLNGREVGFIPNSNLLRSIKIFYKTNGEILLIYFYLVSENQIYINEVQELLGEYYSGYNWRDCFTRFNFNGIQNEYIEGIYFEKNNEIIVDKEKNQYIDDDHSGNVTTHQYDGLCFDGFVIKYK